MNKKIKVTSCLDCPAFIGGERTCLFGCASLNKYATFGAWPEGYRPKDCPLPVTVSVVKKKVK